MARLVRPFTSFKEAVSKIPDSARIVTGMAVSEPRELMLELHNVAASRSKLTVYCANPDRAYPSFSDKSLVGKLELITMFLTGAAKNAQGDGIVHYFPHNLSTWARNILHCGPIDVFWGTCTPPDAKGFVSLGPSCCYESEMLQQAKLVICEVNPQLPFVYGSPVLHSSRIDHFVETDHANPTTPVEAPSEVGRKIAENVARLIPDNATLQFGIGSIPNALADNLMDRKNLGIHTEMLNDSMATLSEAGVVNGSKKTMWPFKMVGSFALGTQELYDFIGLNGGVVLHPSSIVNAAQILARQRNMISVNTAVEIDLTGQVCSESVGHRELSGVGGASDTHLGAQLATNGRGIIAIPSLATKCATSKIVAELKPGAKVSISRNSVDIVVIEYGVAELRGRSVAARAESLIAIAHPSVRDELTRQAIQFQYI